MTFMKRIIQQLLHKAMLFDMYIISYAVDVVYKQTRLLNIWKAVLQRQMTSRMLQPCTNNFPRMQVMKSSVFYRCSRRVYHHTHTHQKKA